MPFFEVTDGRLSERIHPGFPANWHGSNMEWHMRYLLYCDALETEKEIARLQSIVAQLPEPPKSYAPLTERYKGEMES